MVKNSLRFAISLCMVLLAYGCGGSGRIEAYTVKEKILSHQFSAKQEVMETASKTETGVRKGRTEPSGEKVSEDSQEPERKAEGKIQVRQLTSGLVELTWEAQEEPGFYRVYREQGQEQEEIMETDQISVKDAVPKGIRVRYRVDGYGKGGKWTCSYVSEWVCVPEKAGEVHTTRQKSTAVKISFQARGANRYQVARKTARGTYKLLGEVKKPSYRDTSVKVNTVYTYRITPIYKNKNKERFTGKSTTISFSGKEIVDTSHQKYSYTELKQDIQQLKQRYYDYMDYEVMGESVDGRNLYAVQIGNPKAGKQLLVVANLHGREYMSAQLCMKQIEYTLEQYNRKIAGKDVAKLLDRILLRVIPMANPDGTVLSQKGISGIQKKEIRQRLQHLNGIRNHRRWKANARGVDLNRNWTWHHKKIGSPSSEGYPGTKALSEKETQAMDHFIRKIHTKQQKIVGIVNYHTQGNIIFGSINKGTDKTTAKVTRGMYKLARSITGYASSAFYQGSGIGNFRDYHMMVLKIPGITIEVGTNTSPVSIGQFPAVWRKNKSLVISEAAYLAGY